MSTQRQAGFTLIEMLISLFIFALISTGTMMALHGALRGKTQMDVKVERLQQIDTARALIRADMAALTLRPVRDEFGNFERYSLQSETGQSETGLSETGQSKTGTLLRFTRTGRANPAGLAPRGDVQRLAYVFEQGALVRKVLTQANPAPDSPTIERPLITGLTGAAVSFVVNDQEVPGLSVLTSSTQTAPAVMKLALIYENGDTLQQVFEVGS